MVESFAQAWELSDYKMTATGSWLEDQERLPGFWDEVHLYVTLYKTQEDGVKELVKAMGQPADSGTE
jgi:hypothetical protein